MQSVTYYLIQLLNKAKIVNDVTQFVHSHKNIIGLLQLIIYRHTNIIINTPILTLTIKI